MERAKEWVLSLEGEAFNALKTDFNAVLRRTLSNTEVKESETAEMTVKVKITLSKEQCPNGDELPRDILMPKFDHKVSSVMQIRDELSGMLGGNYELVWCKEQGEWVMRPIIDDQTTLFDEEDYATVDDEVDADFVIGGSTDEALPAAYKPALLTAVAENNESAVGDYSYEAPNLDEKEGEANERAY